LRTHYYFYHCLTWAAKQAPASGIIVTTLPRPTGGIVRDGQSQ